MLEVQELVVLGLATMVVLVAVLVGLTVEVLVGLTVAIATAVEIRTRVQEASAKGMRRLQGTLTAEVMRIATRRATAVGTPPAGKAETATAAKALSRWLKAIKTGILASGKTHGQ